jgi:serine/threonine protein kinase
MGELEDEESGFSLGGLPEDFGKPTANASDAENFPAISGFRIVRLLGQGGMGAVYEAISLDDPARKVAIKTLFLPRFQTIQPETRRRFEREMELLGRFKHPQIVPILEQGSYEREFQRVPYFTMPLLERGDLADALERSPINNRESLQASIDQLCAMLEGLAVAHRRGIVHRDIKPRNLFIGDDNSLLLGDFGLAKIFHEDSELTSTIGRMGTTPYAPPEQLLSAKLADARADIYAVGVILHQFVCFGIRPFEPDSYSEKSSSESDSIARWQRSSDRQAPVPSARKKNLSDRSLDFIVQKCLAYDPEDRYQSVEDLLVDLRKWRRGEVVRGSWREQLRNRLLAPVKAQLIPLAMGAAILVGLVSMAAWSRFSKLSEDVSSLKEDVDKERLRQVEAAQNRESELREELLAQIPRMKGEPREYELRRLPNPENEFKLLSTRLKSLSEKLGLENSPQFMDRHHHWVILRTSVAPSLSDDSYSRHMRHLIGYSQSNLQIAESSGKESDIVLAASDLLRSHRLLLQIAWYITVDGSQKRFRAIIDADQLLKDYGHQFAELEKMSVFNEVPALKRHLNLLKLEYTLKDPSLTPKEVLELCSDHRNEFTAEQLRADPCEQLHPWYLAWYLFELYYDTASKLKLPVAEVQPIVDAWYEVTTSIPSPGKEEQTNIVYLMDLLSVDDRRGDVLRELGQVEMAKRIYESNWVLCESLRTFYTSNPKIWELSEQTVSSLLKLADTAVAKDDLRLNYGRQQKLLREKLKFAGGNSDVFDEDLLVEAKFDLADSLYRHARLLEPSEGLDMANESMALSTEIAQEKNAPPSTQDLLRATQRLLDDYTARLQ